MSDWLQQALSPQRIYNAYRKVRNSPTPWSLAVNYHQWRQRPEYYLLELMESLRSGRYRPDPVRSFSVLKSDGKPRVISAQMLKDKVAQRVVADLLSEKLDGCLSPSSFAYRPGRNVELAVNNARQEIHLGKHWIVQADIRQCFDWIPHRKLRKCLKHWVPDKQLQALFELWLDQYAHQAGILTQKKGIMQGAVISPLWCNLYLHTLDSYLTRHRITFVRYADNLMLFTNKEPVARKALKTLETGLGKLELELNQSKTYYGEISPRDRFLGQPLLQRTG